jgi:hypothetical protein
LKVLPFHRAKLIQKAAFLNEMEIANLKELKIGEGVADILCNYKFSSNGPYSGDHSSESLKNFIFHPRIWCGKQC